MRGAIFGLVRLAIGLDRDRDIDTGLNGLQEPVNGKRGCDILVGLGRDIDRALEHLGAAFGHLAQR